MKGKKLSKRIVAAIVVGSFLTVTTACYGPFNLTKNVYHWNSNIKGSSEVNEKWMKEFVFFGMIIIPVYMFSALLDAFIFNSIQFWSGSNPVKANDGGGDGAIRVVRLGGITVTMSENDRGTTVLYERNGIVRSFARRGGNGTGWERHAPRSRLQSGQTMDLRSTVGTGRRDQVLRSAWMEADLS
jgi:hypothetical protein